MAQNEVVARPRCLACPRADRLYRGLCWYHYEVLWRAVRAGKTSWAQLEAEGRCLPAKKPGQGWARWNAGFWDGRKGK